MPSRGQSTVSASMAEARNYFAWILDEFRPFLGTRIMEVGLAHSHFLPHFTKAEDYLGVDLDPEVITTCAAQAPRAAFLAADVSDSKFVEQVGRRRYDTIVCVNVLEHIPNDAAAVRNLLDVLDAGGHLLLLVPAFQSLYTDLDRLAGHVRRYTRASLAEVLPAGEVRVERLEYFNPLGALGWWAQRCVRHETLDSRSVSTQVQVFDRVLVPVSRRCNGLTKRWFGQSVLCALRKA